MTFMDAVNREIANRNEDDPTRITLEFLRDSNATRSRPVPLSVIVSHLNDHEIDIGETGFQQTILAISRDQDYFIGSGPKGYFLIRSEDDAKEVWRFYTRRITAESQNRANLVSQAARFGWNIES